LVLVGKAGFPAEFVLLILVFHIALCFAQVGGMLLRHFLSDSLVFFCLVALLSNFFGFFFARFFVDLFLEFFLHQSSF